MAIYSTKSNKLNHRKKKIKLGIALISIFSVLLLLVSFNLFKIFSIIVLGSIGLLFYPLCLFFILLGILILCNKTINVSRSIIVLSILWLCFFVLIMQLATSNPNDIGYGEYLVNIFKYDISAGGVLFGLILYPLHYLTHTLAMYILLSVVLVVITAFLIDKIRLRFKAKEILTVSDISSNEIHNVEMDEEYEEVALSSSTSDSIKNSQIDDDIFIADEDSDEREEAKSILGLSNNRTIRDLENIVEASNKTPDVEEIEINNTKPNIIVHEEDNLDFNINKYVISKSPKDLEAELEKKKDEERKKAALDYLNISKGKFTAKNQPKGFDNVTVKDTQTSPPPINESYATSLIQQTAENNDRLNIARNMQSFNSSTGSIDKNELYDNNLTKKSFESGSFTPQQIVVPNIQSNFSTPKKAQEVYSGEFNSNIVEASGFRPVQVSMNEPPKPKPVQKIYKKPPAYIKPPVDLLVKHSSQIENDEKLILEKSEKIVKTLENFKINTRVIDAIKGPTFTRYELQMAPGISVNSISPKIADLSMALESSCRVQIPIPGKNAFGIEVPNKKRMTVGLRDIIESSNFQSSKSPLTIALGKDISNECKTACIDKMVHTLVAGSTGSGKSVCLHTILISLLYKVGPDMLKLLLVDPKMVEFPMYNNLPHMLIPNAITDCDKAVQALSWLVDEMERRYKRLNSVCVRNIEDYNNCSEVLSGQLPKMFYIVMVFDEVGDYMTIAKKEIEEKIVRLAAKSRACGIHLILTTQRPTTDVITGTIKANLPSRIAFAVSSYQDSKTILDGSGAEYLLGMGDMLFLPKGTNDTDRIQCAYLSDQEIKSVINFVKENNETDFDEEIVDQMFNKKEGFDPTNGAEEMFDPMLKECLKYFIKAKKASASSLQGYFAMGYPKANKIVLQMEKAGFVSPQDHNGRRTLYITEQEFAERFGEEIDE